VKALIFAQKSVHTDLTRDWIEMRCMNSQGLAPVRHIFSIYMYIDTHTHTFFSSFMRHVTLLIQVSTSVQNAITVLEFMHFENSGSKQGIREV
jgi:hypothetical protein